MAMIVRPGDQDEPAAVRGAARQALSLTVLGTLEAAEPVWRRLEAGGAVLTPYQRYDWIAAWHAAAARPEDLAVLIIERAGRPVALLPLALERRLGLTRATIPGSEIGNADWMIVMPDAVQDLEASRIMALLREAGRRVGGIDLVALLNMPATWSGVPNPLLTLPHRPGPNRLYLGGLNAQGTFDRLDDRRRSHLLQRWRRLGALAGAPELRTAATPVEIDSFLDVFLAQRAARFAQMGIPNIFAAPRFVRFFRDAAVAALGSERPAVLIQTLQAGDRVVGSAIATVAGAHYSQYINATSGDADIARLRLIGLLMHTLFADAASRGCTSIDMGLGDFDYKLDWTEPTPVCDAIVPLTLKGGLAAAALAGQRALKGTIKRNERLWALAKSWRARLGVRTKGHAPS